MAMSALALRLIVHERLVPAMKNEAAAAPNMLNLCLSLRAASAAAKAEQADAVVAASLQELHDISGFFVALLSPEANACGTSVTTLDEVKNGTGAKGLVRAKLGQFKYWKNLEGRYRTAVVAHKTDGPIIDKVITGMKADDGQAVAQAIEKLPTWQDRLRSVTVVPVERTLQEYFEQRLQTWKSALEKEEVSAEQENPWKSSLSSPTKQMRP